MPAVIEYRAKEEFKYGNETIEKGEVWTPGGGRYDAKMIEHGVVYAVEVGDVQEIVERKKRRPSLKEAQIEALMEWLEEGLETDEILDRAAAFRPAFIPTARQLKYYQRGVSDGSEKNSGAGETSAN